MTTRHQSLIARIDAALASYWISGAHRAALRALREVAVRHRYVCEMCAEERYCPDFLAVEGAVPE